jgi:glycosyltransferase involved in cell wall biosynthesis
MKIDVLCHSGSPIGVTMKTLYGQDGKLGVGGAELALLTMCEAWTKVGHEVTLYNDPKEFFASPFEQKMIGSFNSEANRDVVIIFRSPNSRAIHARGLRIFWSCDQQTTGDYRDFSIHVNKTVCISPFHQKYFEQRYGINDTVSIDLPVRISDYNLPGIEKIPHRFIFTSVPDRGLHQLRQVWPWIKQLIPDASLVITSDYRLWGVDMPMNEKHRMEWLGEKDVEFMGAIPRRQLIEEQLKADMLLYPCIYDELFCYTIAEAQVAGAYPITSNQGTCATTNSFGTIFGSMNDPAWQRLLVSAIDDFLTHTYFEELRSEMIKDAINRFSPEKILQEWDEKVFKGGWHDK